MLSNSFRYKDAAPKGLISGVVYKRQCSPTISLIMAKVSDTQI